MENATESQIWRLIQALEKISGDSEAASLARAATETLRQLVGTGIFGSMAGRPLALMQVIASDPKIKEADRIVAKVLLGAFDPDLGYASLSKPQISARTGFSVSKIRMALRRLVEAGYFVAIVPTKKEWDDGDYAIKHQPCFDAVKSAISSP